MNGERTLFKYFPGKRRRCHSRRELHDNFADVKVAFAVSRYPLKPLDVLFCTVRTRSSSRLQMFLTCSDKPYSVSRAADKRCSLFWRSSRPFFNVFDISKTEEQQDTMDEKTRRAALRVVAAHTIPHSPISSLFIRKSLEPRGSRPEQMRRREGSGGKVCRHLAPSHRRPSPFPHRSECTKTNKLPKENLKNLPRPQPGQEVGRVHCVRGQSKVREANVSEIPTQLLVRSILRYINYNFPASHSRLYFSRCELLCVRRPLASRGQRGMGERE